MGAGSMGRKEVGNWRQIESRTRRDCPQEYRRLYPQNHDMTWATIHLSLQRKKKKKRSQENLQNIAILKIHYFVN